jgi:hypothetical protein
MYTFCCLSSDISIHWRPADFDLKEPTTFSPPHLFQRSMDEADDRWALPDWPSALAWCRGRNREGIRCIIDILGENAKDEADTIAGIISDYEK